MQPSPIAETARLLFPSVRIFIDLPRRFQVETAGPLFIRAATHIFVEWLRGPSSSRCVRDSVRPPPLFWMLRFQSVADRRAKARSQLRLCFLQGDAAWLCRGWERSTASAPAAMQAESWT